MRKLLILLLLVSSAAMAAKIQCSTDMFHPLTVYDKALEVARCISSEVDMGKSAISVKHLATPGAEFMMLKTSMFEGDKETSIMFACGKANRPGWFLCTAYWYDASTQKWNQDPNVKNKATSAGDLADMFFSSLVVKPADERYLFFGDDPPWAN